MVKQAKGSFMAQAILDRPQNWPRQHLERVQRVDAREAERVVRKWLPSLFDASKCIGVISTSPETARDRAKELKALGFIVTGRRTPAIQS